MPYHWSYKFDDINLEKGDPNQIIYEFVNRKASKPTDKDKRASKPRIRKNANSHNKHEHNFKKHKSKILPSQS